MDVAAPGRGKTMKTIRQFVSIGFGLLLAAGVPSQGRGQTWTKASPGAGGAFTCVDMSANGTVLVGSDLSGLYKRENSSSGWTRIGHSDGIKATAVDAVKWKPGDNNVALAGTRNGLYRTTNGGSSWSVVSGSWGSSDDVTAIGWSPTTTSTCYIVTVTSGGSTSFSLWKSTDSGASFSSYTHGISSGRRIVKILVDPKVSDGEKVYVVSGSDQGLNGNKELYKADNGGTFSLISGSFNAIDVAVDSTHNDLILMTTSDSSHTAVKNFDNTGTIQMSVNDGSTWNQVSNTTTGAIWFNGGNAYVVNVHEDACPGAPARAGKFLLASGDNWASAGNVAIARQDDGNGTEANTAAWDLGWTDCPHARGRAYNSVAYSLSARGEYWVTPQFAWRHNTSGSHKYENAFTTISSGTYQTKGIDNANPWVVAMGNSSSTLYAGYHDLGLWKSTDNGLTWTNKTPDLGAWDTKGGNVSTILVSGGDTLFAAMAENDDPSQPGQYTYDFALRRSTDGGDTWSAIGDFGTAGFFHSLHKNSSTGRMWVTYNGKAYYSDNRGTNWSQAGGSIPGDGIFVVTTINDVVLAGGWAGLWRSANHGSSWSEVTSGNDFDFSDAGDDKGDLDELQHVSWHGVQQILVDENVWVVSYVDHSYSGSTNKGIWRSSDNGATFSAVMDTTVRRGIAIDPCSRRVHITSGTPHTSGTNSGTALDRASGKLTCPLDASGNFVYTKCKVDASGTDYRYRFGGAVVSNGNSDYVYVSVPGNGLMRQTLESGDEDECETQFGGGGGAWAHRPREEVAAPAIERNMFSLKEVHDREYYDLSGRKVKVTKPGIYFERLLLPGKATRRTVLVTP
jgi:hypothetical protein